MNWIEKYNKANPGLTKFQEGGAVPAAPAGGEGGGGQDPAAMLEQMLAQYAQSHDPQLAVQIADFLLQMTQGQGGGAPAGPEGGAPADQGGAPPMAKYGMRVPTRGPVFRK